MKINFAAVTGEERVKALAAFAALSDEDRTAAFAETDNETLVASLDVANAEVKALFALDTPTIAQVDQAETLLASADKIKAEVTAREAAVKDAAERFAAAKAKFSAEPVNDGVEDGEDEESDDEDTEETEATSPASDAEGESTEGEGEGDGEAAVTASAVDHTKSQTVKVSAARKVAGKVKRPDVKKTQQVVITAGADIQGIPVGKVLDGMEEVTKALMTRTKGFAPFSLQSAQAVHSQSGGQPVLSKFGVASFDTDFDPSLVASGSNEYAAVRNAIKGHNTVLTASMGAAPGSPDAMTAAGWCAPSENIYSYIADYVVDGLSKTPEVKAPRGGLNITTGPARSSQGEALEDFGFVQTEAEAIAQTPKTCETIVCPPFEDHRLDAMGYCYKIPLLTQKAYPELITDALKFAGVLYAHKVNERVISDKVALSVAREFSGYGPSFTDSLEALSILAVKERRKWNIGENATLTVEVPVWAKEVLRADMSRRAGLSLDDVATDQKIAAHFAARKLNVEYVSDWQELTGEDMVLPPTFDVLVYPSGTFVKAIEDVVNLSAVYDAASLTINEYTGVFFEQGYLLAKVGYGSSVITIPVNTAGEAGALTLTGFGDATSGGSF